MLRRYLFQIYLLLTIFLSSCYDNHNISSLLYQTDSLLDLYPDSSLVILNSINIDNISDEEELMHLVWNKAMAHYKLEMSMTEDTLLEKAIDFYKNDTSKIYQKYLLKNIYLQWLEKNDDAMQTLNEGISFALSRKDTTNMLIIQRKKLELLYKLSRFNECRTIIEKLLQIPDKLPIQELYQMTYSLALVSQLGGDTSNMEYHQKGYEIAKAAGDTTFAIHIMRNYGDALLYAGRPRESIEKFRQVINEDPDYLPEYVNLSMATNYINLGEIDSAKYYTEVAEKLINNIKKENKDNTALALQYKLYNIKTIFDYIDGKPLNIMKFSRICADLEAMLKDKHKTEMQKQETKNKLQEKNYHLIIDRQKSKLRVMMISSIMLVTVLFIIIIYQRNIGKKERIIKNLSEHLQSSIIQQNENKILIEENNIQIEELKAELLKQKNNEEEHIKQSLSILEKENYELNVTNRKLQEKIDIYWKKLDDTSLKEQHRKSLAAEILLLRKRDNLLTEKIIQENETISALREKPHFISDAEYIKLFKLANAVYNDFCIRLRNQYTNLTNVDIQICTLIKLGFTISQIAVFCAISPTSVSQQKSRMKKRIIQINPEAFISGESLDIWLNKF